MKSTRWQLKHSLVPRDSWLTIAFLLVVSLLLWKSTGISRASAWIPQAILLATLLLLLLRLVWELLDARLGPPAPAAGDGEVRSSGLRSAALWITILVVSVALFGLAPGGALFCMAYLRWHAAESWPVCAALSAALGMGLWLFFAVFLGTGLYPGILTTVIG